MAQAQETTQRARGSIGRETPVPATSAPRAAPAAAPRITSKQANEDAKEHYRELKSIVDQAGPGDTPEDAHTLLHAIDDINDYLDQHGALMSAKTKRDFVALRSRCDRLTESTQPLAQAQAGSSKTVRGSVGPPDSFTGPGSVINSVQPRRKAARRVADRNLADDEWASMYQAYEDTAEQAIRDDDKQTKLDVASDISNILHDSRDMIYRRTRLQYERLLKKITKPSRGPTLQQHRAVVREAKKALRYRNFSRASLQRLIDQLQNVPETLLKGDLIRPLYDLMELGDSAGTTSADASISSIDTAPVAPAGRQGRFIIESDSE